MEKNDFVWQVWDLFKEIEQKRNFTCNHISKTTELTPLQVKVLIQLKIDGQTTIGQLAQNLCMDTGNLSKSIKQLTNLNLVHREQALGDNRSVYASLTKSGLQIITEKKEKIEKFLVDFAEILPPDHLLIGLDVLDKFNKYLNSADFSDL